MIVTATRSKVPLFDGSRVKRGASVIAVGASLPTGSELDDTTLGRASRVIVEWKPQSLVEAGEVVTGRAHGVLPEERIVPRRHASAVCQTARRAPCPQPLVSCPCSASAISRSFTP